MYVITREAVCLRRFYRIVSRRRHLAGGSMSRTSCVILQYGMRIADLSRRDRSTCITTDSELIWRHSTPTISRSYSTTTMKTVFAGCNDTGRYAHISCEKGQKYTSEMILLIGRTDAATYYWTSNDADL